MDVCLDPPSRSNSGWNVYIRMYRCLVGVCFCLGKGKQGKKVGGGSLEFCFQQSECPRLVVYSLQLSQQANYVVEKLQQ